jgi:Flp pilus assembly protein TadD
MNRRELSCGARRDFVSSQRRGTHHLPHFCITLQLLFVLSLGAATFESTYRAGLEALGKNDLPAAQAQFEAAAKLQPGNAQVWLALAQTYFKLGKPKLAADAAVRAETLAPADPVVLHGLAFYYTEARDPARAAALEGRYADKSPQDAEAYSRAIDLYLRGSRPKPAILLAQKALLQHDTPELHELLAKALDADGQFEKAIVQFRQAAKMRPYDESYAFELGQAYLRRQKFAEALEVFQGARKLFDKSAQIQLALGVALYGLRRFPETIDAFLLTIHLDPEVEQPYLFLGRMIDQAEAKMPDVSAALATYVSVKPDSYISNFLYAKALIAQNAEPDQVEPLLRKSVALNGKYWESHFELGTVLEKKRDYPAAALELQKSIELNPKDPTAHYHLARVYDRLGKPELAAQQRALHAALSKSPTAASMK